MSDYVKDGRTLRTKEEYEKLLLSGHMPSVNELSSKDALRIIIGALREQAKQTENPAQLKALRKRISGYESELEHLERQVQYESASVRRKVYELGRTRRRVR